MSRIDELCRRCYKVPSMKDRTQDTIGLLIGMVRRRLKQIVAERLAPYDLSPQQYWILLLVLEGENLSPRKITERIFMDKATASRMLDKLVRSKWIMLTRDPQDRRRLRIDLTPLAKRRAGKLRRMAQEIDRQLMNGISAAQAKVLDESLRRMLENLGEAPPPRR